MSATGECQALFAVKYLLHPSSFLRNEESNLSPRLAIIGGEQALFLYAVALAYSKVKIYFKILPRR
jgi:hypothetical protein